MSFESELDIYLRARFTLMLLVTPEEERALHTVKVVCERTQRACFTWDLADGFQALADGGAPVPSARGPLAALDRVDKVEGSVLFVLKDFHDCWSNVQVKGKLRSVAQHLKFTRKSTLVTSPSSKLPLRKRLPQNFDVARLARESEGYVGAELAQAIIDAMYVGFNAGARIDHGRYLRRLTASGAAVHLPARDHRRAAQLAARRAGAVGVVPGELGGGAAVGAVAN